MIGVEVRVRGLSPFTQSDESGKMDVFWYHERALRFLVTVSELVSGGVPWRNYTFSDGIKTRCVVPIETAAATVIMRIDMDGVLC